MTTYPGRRAAAAAAGVALALAACSVTACSGPRSGASVTGDVSGCAAVLPLARDIVHGQGTLTVVRRINKADADALTRKVGATSPPPAPPHATSTPARPPARARAPQTCLVVYRGDYPPGAIAGASPPAAAGHYALIVLRVRHPAVDRILITDTLPPEIHR
ncbi:MAG TPA: hypothetical protein VIY28_17755 [Pseudonocardiaceae bacterium]